MTISNYRRAYESAVGYGLRKALEAKLEAATRGDDKDDDETTVVCTQVQEQVAGEKVALEDDKEIGGQNTDRARAYYESELAKRDEIIAQQRAVIKALGQNQK